MGETKGVVRPFGDRFLAFLPPREPFVGELFASGGVPLRKKHITGKIFGGDIPERGFPGGTNKRGQQRGRVINLYHKRGGDIIYPPK